MVECGAAYEGDRKVRIMLCIVVLCLLVVCGISFFEIFWWGTLQSATRARLFRFTVADSIVPIPAALLAATVQTFFAERACQVLPSRRRSFFAFVVLLACMAVAAAICAGISTREQQSALSCKCLLSVRSLIGFPYILSR